MAWKLAQCRWHDKLQLDAYLKEGWEPFAVTERDRGQAARRRAIDCTGSVP